MDGGIGAVVPEAGMTVTADATSTDGHQHLVVSNPRGDEVSFDGVGPMASSPNPCRDGY